MEGASHPESRRVLAHGMVDGHILELVQEPDGTSVILQDGEPVDGMGWPAASFEGCMRTYLGMLRHRPPTD